MLSDKARILAVDDVPMNLEVLRKALDSIYIVKTVESGLKALQLLEKETFDLILLDIVMPDLDGFSTYRRIRSTPNGANTPIVFLTAQDDHESEYLGLSLGAADFVFKPIRVELIRLRIRNILALSCMRQDCLASEERLRFVMDATGEGIWDWNMRSNMISHNRAWCDMLGFDIGMQNHSISMLSDIIHPEDWFRVQLALNRSLKEAGAPYHSEHRLRHAKGHYVWVEDHGRVVTSDQDGKPLRMVGSTKDITLRKENEARMEQLAFFDQLTGLPNRRLFFDRLNQAHRRVSRSKNSAVIIFVDLDQFKKLNDDHGHASGDRLLIEVGERLTSVVRQDDTVARFGGDEFVILLENLPPEELEARRLANEIADNLLQRLQESWEVHGSAYEIRASLGAAILDKHSTDVDAVLAAADQAMYRSKSAGGGTLVFYSV